MLEPPPNNDQMRCPNCAELIKREAILCRFCDVGLSVKYFRPCPQCAESIRKDATYCRFCRSNVSNDPLTLSESIQQKISEFGKIDRYGSGVRQQVFEVIIRQALAGAPWREICAVPMRVNNISPEEVEAELEKRP